MTDAPRAQAGWYPDPTGRHEHRFWDGGGWTINVADDGVAGIDSRAQAAMAAQGGDATVAAAATAATPPPPGAPGPGSPVAVDAPSTRRSGRRARSLVSAAIVAVAAVAGFFVARTVLSGPDEKSAGYPAAVEANFVSSCVDGGGTRDTCRCALTKIEADFDLDEFADAEREYAESGALPDEMRTAAIDCLSEQTQEH